MENKDPEKALSNIKYLEMADDLAEFRPAEPPTNFQLALLPKIGVWVLGAALFVGGVVAGILGMNDHKLEILVPLGIPGATIGALILFWAKDLTAVRLRSLISLLPGSLWRVMQEKTEAIASLQQEADAFDARVAAYETAESLGFVRHPSQLKTLEEERARLEELINMLLKLLREAKEIDDRRYAFFASLAKTHFQPGSIETIYQHDAIDAARTNMRAACETFGVNIELLTRYVPYLR